MQGINRTNNQKNIELKAKNLGEGKRLGVSALFTQIPIKNPPCTTSQLFLSADGWKKGNFK